jgi:hypothetical protein
MRRIFIIVGVASFAAAATAQQALQCANPDVLNALVFGAMEDSRLVVKLEMPADPAGFRAPTGFTLIGSGVRGQNLATTVAYKTTLETRMAFDSLIAFLAEEGWKPEGVPQLAQLAISVAGSQSAAAQVCRNSVRRHVQVREVEGTRYATISGSTAMPPRVCDAPTSLDYLLSNPMAMVNARQAQMPRLSFPDSVRLGSLPVGAEGDTHNNTFSTTYTNTTRIESPDSAASLARHLARQLSEQGWRSDADWSGKLSSGSTWSRRNAEGQSLGGMLEILSVDEGVFDVAFTLTMRRQ